MSDFGLFESVETSETEQRVAARESQQSLDNAIHAVSEKYGTFLRSAATRQDYKDRVGLIKTEMMNLVAEHLMPLPAVMRRVIGSQKPDFSKKADTEVNPEHLPDTFDDEGGFTDLETAPEDTAPHNAARSNRADGSHTDSRKTGSTLSDRAAISRERNANFRKGAPFAEYDDFADCTSKNSDKADPDAYCGEIKHRTEDKTAARTAAVNWTDASGMGLNAWELEAGDKYVRINQFGSDYELTYENDAIRGMAGWTQSKTFSSEAEAKSWGERLLGLTAAKTAGKWESFLDLWSDDEHWSVTLSPYGDFIAGGWGDFNVQVYDESTVSYSPTYDKDIPVKVRGEDAKRFAEEVLAQVESGVSPQQAVDSLMLTWFSNYRASAKDDEENGKPLIPKADWKGYLREREKATQKVKKNITVKDSAHKTADLDLRDHFTNPEISVIRDHQDKCRSYGLSFDHNSVHAYGPMLSDSDQAVLHKFVDLTTTAAKRSQAARDFPELYRQADAEPHKIDPPLSGTDAQEVDADEHDTLQPEKVETQPHDAARHTRADLGSDVQFAFDHALAWAEDNAWEYDHAEPYARWYAQSVQDAGFIGEEGHPEEYRRWREKFSSKRAQAAQDFPELYRRADTEVDPGHLPDHFDDEGSTTDLDDTGEDTAPHNASKAVADPF
jgi:hypothetical protein